jgi:hypothetical protein
VTRSTTLLPRSRIASTPATTADPASFATSCATRVTRAIGAGTRDALFRLPPDLAAAARDPVLDLAVAALRVELLLLELRLDFVDPPVREDVERPDDALRVADIPDAAADRPRDFVLFVLFLLPLRDELLRDELLPRDFPRDFLALVAIDASPRSP